MKGRYFRLRVFPHNLGLDEDRNPVGVRVFAGLDAVHGEATGETCDTAKHRFERLDKMVRDEVFVYLDGSHPRLTLVGYTCLATDPHDSVVGLHAVDEVLEGVGVDLGIRVDLWLAPMVVRK